MIYSAGKETFPNVYTALGTPTLYTARRDVARRRSIKNFSRLFLRLSRCEHRRRGEGRRKV